MPVNVTLEMVQQLLEQNASLLRQNEILTATIAELNQTIQELKEQINKNSKNSSKPPSSDGYKNLLLRVCANHPEKRSVDRMDIRGYI
ncbi:hypothetical protein C823_007549 [Eubacterium plexicaudatum ASF492]|nr:hypothetical protein C823_007549 [Eubacterium plexicaudatum ASF492]